uniref:Uncharacterized protein n=1 Tax=Anguilla anguilla TaxID=7936 RepID=A0A0E9U5D7_ANGAN
MEESSKILCGSTKLPFSFVPSQVFIAS